MRMAGQSLVVNTASFASHTCQPRCATNGSRLRAVGDSVYTWAPVVRLTLKFPSRIT
jgi:hypothetical protein